MRFARVTPRLPVTSLGRTVAFYRDILGFTVDVAYPEVRPTFAILSREDVQVAFFEPDEHRPDRQGYAELYIEVDGVRELHAQIVTQVLVEWGPEVYSYGRREFAVNDPDGVLVIFTEETDDPPTTHEPE